MWLFLWQINKSEHGHEEYRKIHEETFYPAVTVINTIGLEVIVPDNTFSITGSAIPQYDRIRLHGRFREYMQQM
jgi:hypothetical protein